VIPLDDQTTLSELRTLVERFVSERGWQPFHSPKNLSASISIEAAELLEIFQWLTIQQSCQVASSPDTLQHVREELADVLIYCLSLANALDIDVSSAIKAKMRHNETRYPVGAAHGNLQGAQPPAAMRPDNQGV